MLRLSLDALQVLDAIARRGSFAAAGEELHRTTSTLSYTVKKLEDDLGIRVFDRSGHRAALTEVGRMLLDEGRTLLDAAAAVERRVRSLGTGWEAEVAIAYNDLIPVERLLPVLTEFYAAGHPTRVKLSAEVLGGAWEALAAQRADIAIADTALMGDAADLAHRPAGAISFVFAVAPSHPLAREPEPLKIAAVRRYRVVVAADSSRSRAPQTTGIVGAADVLTVSSMRAKLAAQVAGLGVGFLPTTLAADAIARGELVVKRINAPKPRTPLSVAWREADAGPACRWLVERLAALSMDDRVDPRG